MLLLSSCSQQFEINFSLKFVTLLLTWFSFLFGYEILHLDAQKKISMRPPLNAVETKRAAGCDEQSFIDRKQRGGQRGSSLRKVNVD